MARIEMITMSMHEIDRLKTIEAVANSDLKPNYRQHGGCVPYHAYHAPVQHLVRPVSAGRCQRLLSRKRNRPGKPQLLPGVGMLALTIIRERYADLGRRWRASSYAKP